jgi:hypothetical protein
LRTFWTTSRNTIRHSTRNAWDCATALSEGKNSAEGGHFGAALQAGLERWGNAKPDLILGAERQCEVRWQRGGLGSLASKRRAERPRCSTGQGGRDCGRKGRAIVSAKWGARTDDRPG